MSARIHRGMFLAGLLALLTMTSLALPRTLDPRQIVTLNGKQYVTGEFYLDAAADTAALKQAGMRRFEFLGHSVRSVRYAALVPVNMDFSRLPQHVTCLTDTPPEPEYVDYVQGFYGAPVWDRHYNRGFDYYYSYDRNTAGYSQPWAQYPSPRYDRYGGYYGSSGCQPNYDYYGYRSHGRGYRGGSIGYDYPPTDRPSRRNSYTYDEPCPVFGIPSTGTYLLSPGNPARPVIGTPQPCH